MVMSSSNGVYRRKLCYVVRGLLRLLMVKHENQSLQDQ